MASNGITYEIFMEAAEVERVLGETATMFPRYINSWLVEASNLVKEEMSSKAPEGVAGVNGQGLKNNIGIEFKPAEMSAEIKPNSSIPYADAVETGSRPHMPPAGPDSALAQWCEMKGLNVWAVAKSIATKGTQPHPYIEPTYQSTKLPVAERFSLGVTQYLERMQYGSL